MHKAELPIVSKALWLQHYQLYTEEGSCLHLYLKVRRQMLANLFDSNFLENLISALYDTVLMNLTHKSVHWVWYGFISLTLLHHSSKSVNWWFVVWHEQQFSHEIKCFSFSQIRGLKKMKSNHIRKIMHNIPQRVIRDFEMEIC